MFCGFGERPAGGLPGCGESPPIKNGRFIMPVKKKTSAAPKVKKGNAYECGVCGVRVVVDEACGCAEEHVFLCCDKPMKKAAAKKK